MSHSLRASRGEVVELNAAVEKSTGGVTGLTMTVSIRRAETTNSYLDFSDNTFKAAGWTTKDTPMTEVGRGAYAKPPGLDLASITNLPTTTKRLVAEYVFADSGNHIGMDVIEIPFSSAIPSPVSIRVMTQTAGGCCDAGGMQMHVGDFGVPFVFEVLDTPAGYDPCTDDPCSLGPVNIAAFVSATVWLTKPDGTVVAKTSGAGDVVLTTAGTDGKYQYVIEPGILDQSGTYRIQGRIEMPTFGRSSGEVCFKVLPNLGA